MVLLVLLAVAISGGSARCLGDGIERVYLGDLPASGAADFDYPDNWSPAGVPEANDVIVLQNTGGTISYPGFRWINGHYNNPIGTYYVAQVIFRGKNFVVSGNRKLSVSGRLVFATNSETEFQGDFRYPGPSYAPPANATILGKVVNTPSFSNVVVEASGEWVNASCTKLQNFGSLTSGVLTSELINEASGRIQVPGAVVFKLSLLNRGTIEALQVGDPSGPSIANEGTIVTGTLMANSGRVGGILDVPQDATQCQVLAGTSEPLVFEPVFEYRSTKPLRLDGQGLWLPPQLPANFELGNGRLILGPNFQGGNILSLPPQLAAGFSAAVLAGTNRIGGEVRLGINLEGAWTVGSGAQFYWGPTSVQGGYPRSFSGSFLAVEPGGVLEIVNAPTMGDKLCAPLTNAGTTRVLTGLVLLSGETNQGRIQNLAGGLLEIGGDTVGGLDLADLVNEGRLRLDGGWLGTGVRLVNRGVVGVGPSWNRRNAWGTVSGPHDLSAGTLEFGPAGALTFGTTPQLGGRLLLKLDAGVPSNTIYQVCYWTGFTPVGSFGTIEVPGYSFQTNYTANGFTIEVLGPAATKPSITTPPATHVVSAGAEVRLSVAVAGTEPFLYQWIFDGQPMAGATNSVLVVPSAQATDVGVYSVRISNAGGEVTSPPASLWLSDVQMFAGVVVFGKSGSQCRVDYTADLKEPVAWTTLTNVTVETTPQVFIDFGSPGAPKRFYRTVPMP